MTNKELRQLILSAVNEYLLDEDSFDDNAQLCIRPATWEVYVADGREADVESPEIDCYDVMDFVEMDSEGKWKVDEEIVDSTADEYM